ncbi:hypothetical protein B0H14DRAFT_3164720 [Mycena olivaceomarginata]|nr:hypothetical protein B0H14DRAFT_3164720 [Mycena olivaceomarginata]
MKSPEASWERPTQKTKRSSTPPSGRRFEETGLRVVHLAGEFEALSYTTESLSADEKPVVRASLQLNFVARVEAFEPVTLNPLEHQTYTWVAEDEVEDLPSSVEMKGDISGLAPGKGVKQQHCESTKVWDERNGEGSGASKRLVSSQVPSKGWVQKYSPKANQGQSGSECLNIAEGLVE